MTMFRMLFIALGACLLLATGCVKQPTRSEKTVDDRPAISFAVKNETQVPGEYTILVDKLAMGTADQFLENEAALRLLSGSHVLQLIRGNEIVLEQTLYLGDGGIKVIQLP